MVCFDALPIFETDHNGHDFLRGIHNLLADEASRLTHLSDLQFLHYFNLKYPQNLPWRLWTPSKQMTCAVLCALHRRPYDSACVQVPTAQPLTTGHGGDLSVPEWPSTPYSPISRTRSPSFKSSQCSTARGRLPQWQTSARTHRGRCHTGDWPNVGQCGGPGSPPKCFRHDGFPAYTNVGRL